MHFLHILDQTSVACADVSNNMLLIFEKIKKLCSGLFALLDSCSDLSLNLLLFTLLDCSVKLHLAWINPALLTDNFHPFSSVETSQLHTQIVFLLGKVFHSSRQTFSFCYRSKRLFKRHETQAQ